MTQPQTLSMHFHQPSETMGETMNVEACSGAEQLNRFLAGIERRALKMAELAVGNRDDALDIVQDSMMKLAEKYAGHPAAEWPPLFHRILQSKIRDWYRRSAVRQRLFFWKSHNADTSDKVADPFEFVADTKAIEPMLQASANEFGPALIRAIGRLPLRQQQVFMLRAWEGLDVRQTAQAMACAEGSVKTHYHRATQTLKQLLAEYHEE